ncbi:MAG: hypothetical protein WC253_07445 [Sulfurovaceae bacterium]|jgi:uncharacterized membrane protein YcjF (UPF0283 family)|nr:hypothetical protein [Sulfurovaceae bacterium]
MVEELKDIKPYLTSTEWLYWGFIAAVILLLFLFISIVWWGISRWLYSRKQNLRKQYLQAIKSVDWSNSKNAAYKVSYYGRLLAKDPRSIEILSQLEPMLLEYKYKKDVPKVNDETLVYYDLLIQVLDV